MADALALSTLAGCFLALALVDRCARWDRSRSCSASQPRLARLSFQGTRNEIEHFGGNTGDDHGEVLESARADRERRTGHVSGLQAVGASRGRTFHELRLAPRRSKVVVPGGRLRRRVGQSAWNRASVAAEFLNFSEQFDRAAQIYVSHGIHDQRGKMGRLATFATDAARVDRCCGVSRWSLRRRLRIVAVCRRSSGHFKSRWGHHFLRRRGWAARSCGRSTRAIFPRRQPAQRSFLARDGARIADSAKA